MSYKGPEALADAVNAYLLANMPAKLDALDTTYPDAIVLDDPVSYYIGEKSLLEVPGYPAIFTLVPDMNIELFKTDYIDARYQAVIGVMIMDADTEILKRRLYRYVQAIIELLIAAQANSAIGWFVGQGEFRANFSPIYAGDEVFISDAQITTQIRPRGVEVL